MIALPRILLAAPALLLAAAAPVHEFVSVAISPDGARVASIEGDQSPSGEVAIKSVVIRGVADGAAREIKLPCGAVEECTPSSLAWAPDGAHVSFILRAPGSHAHAIYTADVATGALTRRVAFDGTLAGLRYGPGGRLAVQATPAPPRKSARWRPGRRRPACSAPMCTSSGLRFWAMTARCTTPRRTIFCIRIRLAARRRGIRRHRLARRRRCELVDRETLRLRRQRQGPADLHARQSAASTRAARSVARWQGGVVHRRSDE